eukprot:scaffold139620_cov148-Phaeocystis_antarctica.AAC.1
MPRSCLQYGRSCALNTAKPSSSPSSRAALLYAAPVPCSAAEHSTDEWERIRTKLWSARLLATLVFTETSVRESEELDQQPHTPCVCSQLSVNVHEKACEEKEAVAPQPFCRFRCGCNGHLIYTQRQQKNGWNGGASHILCCLARHAHAAGRDAQCWSYDPPNPAPSRSGAARPRQTDHRNDGKGSGGRQAAGNTSYRGRGFRTDP